MRLRAALCAIFTAIGAALVTQPQSSRQPVMSDVELEQWLEQCTRQRAEIVDDMDDGPCFTEEERPAAKMLMEQPAQWDGITTKIDMYCADQVAPNSDHDSRLGPGRLECRYEPRKEDLDYYRLNPEDIAIAMPSNWDKDNDLSEEAFRKPPGQMSDARLAWATYAKAHGYAFYPGRPDKSLEELEESCPGIQNRTGHWFKPCVGQDLLLRHKYVLIVDRDTMVMKPGLRLEPLFGIAGLLDDSTGKVVAVAEEWGSCKKGIRCPMSGDVNTGIMLFKQTSLTRAMMRNWWYDPTDCNNGRSPFAEEAQVTPPIQPWPFHSYCTGCACLDKIRSRWSYDQLAFYVSVANRTEYRDNITVFKSGCPINSPFADFIAHFVSGSPSHKSYNIYDRAALVGGVWTCTKRILGGVVEDPYERCAICDALPPALLRQQKFGAWSRACPSPEPA